MADVKRSTDAEQVVEAARTYTANASTALRAMNDLPAALELAETLRAQVGEPAINVRFQLVVDEYNRVGQNFTRLGESLNLSRQRAQQLVAQARKRGIVVPPKK